MYSRKKIGTAKNLRKSGFVFYSTLLNLFDEFYNYIIGEEVPKEEKKYIEDLFNSIGEED